MKIKFPVFIQYKKQYCLLMDCLGKFGVKWASGDSPINYIPPYFPKRPFYVLYWKDTNFITFVYKDTESSWLEDNYKECEVEFEN